MKKRILAFAFAFLCAPAAQAQPTLSSAIFALGCFWCGEEAFEKVPGVVAAVSGYTDGRTKNPTYEQVSSGATGHTEAVEVRFDPSRVSYEKLLDVFWLNHDPTTIDRQFCDGGSQYRPGIYWLTEEQRKAAEASKAKYGKLKTFPQPIVTPIVKASQFWPAEDYHQDYYKKNPVRYRFYTSGCGRYNRLDELWGKLRK
ncbi:MAG: peptide-methionine (S)-S-oxide reductase MsrA [Burkholderiales bacterium]|nr:peptide-methionine (S)-S-oxide reductase MsrA [Burkholderiales bacterium]